MQKCSYARFEPKGIRMTVYGENAGADTLSSFSFANLTFAVVEIYFTL